MASKTSSSSELILPPIKMVSSKGMLLPLVDASSSSSSSSSQESRKSPGGSLQDCLQLFNGAIHPFSIKNMQQQQQKQQYSPNNVHNQMMLSATGETCSQFNLFMPMLPTLLPPRKQQQQQQRDNNHGCHVHTSPPPLVSKPVRSTPSSRTSPSSSSDPTKTGTTATTTIVKDGSKQMTFTTVPMTPTIVTNNIKNIKNKPTVVCKAACGKPVTKQTIKKCGETVAALSPHAFLLQTLSSRGYHVESKSSLDCGYYNSRPSPLQIASFGQKVVQAVHTSDCRALSELLSAGLSANPCNSFGDSLVSLACKHANVDILTIFVQHGCDLKVCDSFGRTPLHNVVWSSRFCERMIRSILDLDPHQLFLQDQRGLCPLEYSHKRHWKTWIKLISKLVDLYWKNDKQDCCRREKIGPQPKSMHTPSPTRIKPIPAEMAFKISSGDISPAEAKVMCEGEKAKFGESVPKPKYRPFNY